MDSFEPIDEDTAEESETQTCINLSDILNESKDKNREEKDSSEEVNIVAKLDGLSAEENYGPEIDSETIPIDRSYL